MVKKSSIFEKLKHRWKANAGVAVGRADGGDRVAGEVPASRLGEVGGGMSASAPAERVPGRKLSAKEEAVMAMGEGFRELSSLVRGVQTRMEDQGQRASRMAEEIASLPALGRSQLDLLKRMAEHLEKQNKVGDQLLGTMKGVPQALQGIEKALKDAAATEQRTAQTLGDFRSTMDRIQGSMSQMTASAKTQADAASQLVRDQQGGQQKLVDSLSDSQREGIDRLESLTTKKLDAMRKAQDEQAARLSQLVSSTGRWSQVLVVLLSLTFFALAGILSILALS